MSDSYNQDGLTSIHNHDFMQDPIFSSAYMRGVQAMDLKVVTEFSADAWCMVMAAGYSQCNMVAYHYPAGIAIIASKPKSPSPKTQSQFSKFD